MAHTAQPDHGAKITTPSIECDWPRGTLRESSSEARLVALPANAVSELLMVAGPEAMETMGRSLGLAMGRRAAAGVGGPEALCARSLEFVTAALASQVASAGLGVVTLERWGRTMVIALEYDAMDARFVQALLEGALGAATERPVRCLLLARDAWATRFLVSSQTGVEKARQWLDQGLAWGEVLTRLNQGAGGAS